MELRIFTLPFDAISEGFSDPSAHSPKVIPSVSLVSKVVKKMIVFKHLHFKTNFLLPPHFVFLPI